MKRLLAALVAALVAIGTGVEYIKPKEDLYASNTQDSKYYWELDSSTGSDSISYFSSLYRSMYGVTGSGQERCETDPVTPVRTGEDPWTWGVSQDVFWFVQADQGADQSSAGAVYHPDGWDTQDQLDGYTVKLGSNEPLDENNDGTQHYYITAPAPGEILTSHFANSYGQTMEFQFEADGHTYKMTINDATCWYCCRNKKATEDDVAAGRALKEGGYLLKGNYSANTSNSLKGNFLASGSLLCVGEPGTIITFKKVS